MSCVSFLVDQSTIWILLWKFMNHDDFAPTLRYHSFYVLYFDNALVFVLSERAEGPICIHLVR